MKLIITASIFLILFGFAEAIQRLTKIRHDLTRKFAHILSGTVVFFLPYFLNAREIIILAVTFAILLWISKYLGLLASIHKVNRKTLGEVFFPLGIGISAFFFLPHDLLAFQFGVLVLAFSDALAGIIGESFGKHKIFFLKSTKSMEGSVVFFFATLILVMAMYSQRTLTSILPMTVSSLLLTLIEMMLIGGLDNLLLPVVASYIFKVVVL